MATILPIQPQQQQQQQPQQVSQAPQTGSQDPLFEALVKYITQSPGPSSTTAAELESIINNHTQVQGGREYLESILQPSPVIDPRIWLKSSEAHGFVSTNLDSLTLNFTALQAYVRFNGVAKGFFPPQVWQFKNAKFFYDTPFEKDMPVTFEIKTRPQWQEVIVQFFPEVYIDKKAVAELVIYGTGLLLPPQGANGQGKFTQIFTTQ